MTGNPYKEKRKALALQLISEGYSPEVWGWLPQIARREVFPALGLGSDHLFAAFRREFPLASISELVVVLHAEYRAVRRAERHGESASEPVITHEQAWLRRELSSLEPQAALGMVSQLELLAETVLQPETGNKAGELYRKLRGEKLNPNEIILLASQAKQSMRNLKSAKNPN